LRQKIEQRQELSMWFSIVGITALIVLSILLMTITYSWSQTKNLPSKIKHDLKTPAISEQDVIIQIVGFSKLWFRKQFSLIDKELEQMESGLLRSGLIAAREEYSLQDATQTLHWQLEAERQHRHSTIAFLESFRSSLLPLGLIIALVSLILQLVTDNSSVSGLGVPALSILSFALCLNTLVLRALSLKLSTKTDAEDRALRLSAEGLLMILQHKTPAQVRAQLEGMLSGLDTVKSVRVVDSHSNPRVVKREQALFANSQRAS
jgi:flagellar motor component MotA